MGKRPRGALKPLVWDEKWRSTTNFLYTYHKLENKYLLQFNGPRLNGLIEQVTFMTQIVRGGFKTLEQLKEYADEHYIKYVGTFIDFE